MAAVTAAVGGVVAAGSAIASSAIQAGAAGRAQRRAINAQREAAEQQTAELRRQFDIQMDLMQPFLQQQQAAGSAFASLLGFGEQGSDFGTRARETEFGRQIFENRLFRGIDEDPLVQQARERQLAEDIRGRQLAAGALAEDPRFQFAQETAVVGPEFQESPGFRFALEEAERAGERALSRGGGGFGGRAVIEAQRRAEGLAQQDYYNYVGARQQELARQDAAAAAHQQRQAIDAARLDQAVAGDLSREAAAIAGAQRREELDIGRQDAFFQNLLGGLAGAAGFGNFAGQAAGAAGATGQGLANVYGNLGANLANIYQQGGAQQGAAIGNLFGGLNQAFQGTLGNLLLAQALGGAGGGGAGVAGAPLAPNSGFFPNQRGGVFQT